MIASEPTAGSARRGSAAQQEAGDDERGRRDEVQTGQPRKADRGGQLAARAEEVRAHDCAHRSGEEDDAERASPAVLAAEVGRRVPRQEDRCVRGAQPGATQEQQERSCRSRRAAATTSTAPATPMA